MNLRRELRRRILLVAALASLPVAGIAEKKHYECNRTCTQDGDCETCKIVYCKKGKTRDGAEGDVIVGSGTETICEVPEDPDARASAGRYQLGRTNGKSGNAPRFDGKQAATILQNQSPNRAATVSRPTVDGRVQAPPDYDATIAPTDRWNVRPDTVDVPRRFESWDAFANFAEKNLQATAYRDPVGKLLAVGGRYEWSAGDVPPGEDSPDTLPDVMARLLGGAGKRLVVGDQVLSFAPAGNGMASFSPFSTTAEDCVDRHCIEGKSWLTHLVFYHSVGTRTRQTSGGTEYVARPCCSSGGELVRDNDAWMCRGRRPGAWEYDRQAGRLVPTGPNPFVLTEARSCQRESLSNQLRVRGVFRDRKADEPTVVSAVRSNTREVEIGEWLVGISLGTRELDVRDFYGVCGIHASNRGESARTSEGNTGKDDSYCQ